MPATRGWCVLGVWCVALAAMFAVVHACTGSEGAPIASMPAPADAGHGPVLSPVRLAELVEHTPSSDGLPLSDTPKDESEEVTSAAVAISLTRESAEEAGVGAVRSSVSLTLADALASSPWPEALWDEVEAIAACESGGDASAVGDGGRAFGWLQVRPDYWPRLARSYDLLDGADNLTAGYIAYLEADGFWPWSCAAVLGIGGAG